MISIYYVGELCAFWCMKYFGIDEKEINFTMHSAPCSGAETLNGTFYTKDDKMCIDIFDMTRDTVDIIKTICHEFVHADQYFNRDFFHGKEGIHFEQKWHSLKDIPYRERPWEIEAFKAENDLCENFLVDNPDIIRGILNRRIIKD
jgi:hypothetical protein